MDPNEEEYYFEKRVPNIKDNLKASNESFNAYGDPILTYLNNEETPNDIEVITIRIWIEGNDRDVISALKGGNFTMKIRFVGIMKEFNENIPEVSVNNIYNTINGYGEGMEYSFDYGNNWIGYETSAYPQFDANSVVWVRYAENDNNFASEKIVLNF